MAQDRHRKPRHYAFRPVNLLGRWIPPTYSTTSTSMTMVPFMIDRSTTHHGLQIMHHCFLCMKPPFLCYEDRPKSSDLAYHTAHFTPTSFSVHHHHLALGSRQRESPAGLATRLPLPWSAKLVVNLQTLPTTFTASSWDIISVNEHFPTSLATESLAILSILFWRQSSYRCQSPLVFPIHHLEKVRGKFGEIAIREIRVLGLTWCSLVWYRVVAVMGGLAAERKVCYRSFIPILFTSPSPCRCINLLFPPRILSRFLLLVTLLLRLQADCSHTPGGRLMDTAGIASVENETPLGR